MAELSVGNLNLEITADGSAAIRALEQTADAVKKAGEEADRAGDKAKGAGEEFRGAGDKTKSAGDKAKGAGEEFEGAGDKAKDAGKKAEDAAKGAEESWKKLGDQLTKAGEKMTKFVTLPVVAALTASVKGAADLTETVSKTEVVFDRLSERVMDWSETSIERMGLAQGSALEMASTFGDMGKGMGLELQQATEMSMNLTQLAADLASFKNIRSDVAAQKLNAIYTGETEGLKSLGIVMTQTNLSAFALAQGITKPISAMTQAEQVMLRYQYVMNATKDAQGDFARTGDSLSNQSRKLTESVKQLGESFGSQLIPLVTPIVEKIQQFVQHIAELDSRTKNIIISVAMVAAAIGPLLLIGGKLITFLATLKAAMTALSINPVMLILAAVAAAAAAVIGLNSALNSANQQLDKSSESYKRMKDQLEKTVEARISVDTSEVDEYNKNPPELKTLTLTVEGAQALSDAKKTVEEMTTKHYPPVVIEGKTVDIDGKLKTIRDNIDKLTGNVRFTSDGKIYLDGDADANLDAITQIQNQIDDLEAVIPFIEDPATRAELEQYLRDLESRLDQLRTGVQVQVTLLGKAAVDDLNATIAAMTAENYGKVTVNGEVVDIDDEVDALDKAINALNRSIEITSDGKVHVTDGEGAADAIAQIQAQINTLDTAISFMPDGPEKDKLDAYITQLKSDIAGLKISIEADSVDDATKKIDAFVAAVKELEGYNGKSYAVTGEFTTEGMTAEEIEEYANAITAAASATGDYDDVVNNLDRLAEQKATADKNAILEQATAEAMARARNRGNYDSEEAYQAAIGTVIDDAMAAMAQVDENLATQKAINAVYKNGTRADDVPTAALQYAALADQDQEDHSQEDFTRAASILAAAQENGGVTGTDEETAAARLLLNDLVQTGIESMDALREGYNTYERDMAQNEADLEYERKHHQTAMGVLDEIEPMEYTMTSIAKKAMEGTLDPNNPGASYTVGDLLNLMERGMIGDYEKNGVKHYDEVVGEGEGTEYTRDQMDMFRSLMQNDDGSYWTLQQAAEGGRSTTSQGAYLERIEGMRNDEDERWNKALENFNTQNEAARTNLQATVDAVGQEFSTEALEGAIQSITDAGVEIPEATQQVIESAQQMAEGFNSMDTAEFGTKVDAMRDDLIALAGSTQSDGENVGKGLAQGIRNSTSEAVEAGREMARQVNEAVKGALKIQSPSKVMRDEVGVMIPRGIVAGVKQEEPDLLKAVRGSADKLVSGAASVVSRPESYRTGTGGASPAARMAAIDYDAMGKAMGSAVSRMRFGFHVGANELSEATREADARALAVQTRRIANSYGG